MAKKEYTVISHHRGRETEFRGTLDRLVNEVFGYTLLCGNSWNPRIPLQPKSINSLIRALNNSAYECRRYEDYYTLAEV